MNASAPVISRTAICILSCLLMHRALSRQLAPPEAVNATLAATLGLLAYVAVKLSAFRRKRALVYRLLNAHNEPWGVNENGLA